MTHAFSRRSFLAALAAGTAGPALAKAPLTSLHPVARGEDLRLRTLRTPDEIIERIRILQESLSLEKIVVHMFYGGMPRDKAEKSLRLFAEKVLPHVQAMPTPINPRSLGEPVSLTARPVGNC